MPTIVYHVHLELKIALFDSNPMTGYIIWCSLSSKKASKIHGFKGFISDN